MLLLLAQLTTPAVAAEPTFNASLSASYWGLGIQGKAGPGVKFALWNQPENILFKDTFLKAELKVQLSPAYARLVPTITFSPIAVLEIEAHYAGSVYFGSFSTIKSFASPDADYADAELEKLTGEAGTGQRGGGTVTLQGAAGPMLFAIWGEAERWSTTPFDGRDGCCFFESERELLFAWEETYFSANGVVLYERVVDADKGAKFRIGNMTNYQTAVVTGDELLRSGLITVYSFDRHWTALLVVQPYLKSRAWPTFPPYVGAQVSYSL